MKTSRLFPVLILTAVAGLGAVGLWLLASIAERTKTEVADARQTYALTLKRASASDSAQQEYESLRTLATELESHFQPLDKEIGFFEQLDALADRHTLTTTVKILTEVKPAVPQIVRLEIALSGSHAAISAYLADLTRQDILLWPTKIRQESDGPDRIRATLTLETIWKP